MSEDRPFGWRPFSEQYLAELRRSGLSADLIADMENRNIYSPNETAVLAMELSLSILSVGIRHLGPQFAHDVRAELEKRAQAMSASESVEEQVEAPTLQGFLESADWAALIARSTQDS